MHGIIKWKRCDITTREILKREMDNINWKLWFDKINVSEMKSEMSNVTELVQEFEKRAALVLQEMAPIEKKVVTSRKKQFWFNSQVLEQKRIVRGREKIWHKYREDHQWQALQRERLRYTNILNYMKCNTIGEKVRDCEGNSKKLYDLVSQLTSTKASNPMPEGKTDSELAEGFASYFKQKIKIICENLKEYPQYSPNPVDIPSPIENWSATTLEEVSKIISQMANKQCKLDMIPTSVVKMDLPELNEFLVEIFNMSLSECQFRETWKEALVKPLIKNANGDLVDKNYRPVSNLKFISKVLEKLVLSRLEDHCNDEDLLPEYQLAYRSGFSCKTALVKLVNDILLGFENQECTAMVCIDLSAAFDTVDHKVLLDVLEKKFGIEGNANTLIASYISPRGFKVKVNEETSRRIDLCQGVAQGSCLGPVLYSCYASTVQEVITKEVDIHGYADDHALKKRFNSSGIEGQQQVQNILSQTLTRVNDWMIENRLKMNNGKMEYIVFGSRQQLSKLNDKAIEVNGVTVGGLKCIKYLGSFLDENLSFSTFVSWKCKKAMFNLKRIQKIRRSIDKDTANLLIVSLVITHLDYANSILIGITQTELKRLQKIQNIAAKMVCNKKRYDSATACLRELHWLPVEQRIEYKILTLVFKCFIGQAPKYLQDLLTLKQIYRPGLRSNSDHNVLKVPHVKRQTFAARSFSYMGPCLWNALPIELRTVKH